MNGIVTKPTCVLNLRKHETDAL